MISFKNVRSYADHAALPVFVLASAAGFATLVGLVALIVDLTRPFSQYRALRAGPIIFPADIPFLVGLVAMLCSYEVFSRLVSKSGRNYSAKRLVGFLLFAAALKFIFVSPLAFPRVEQILPLRVTQGPCAVYSELSEADIKPHVDICEAFTKYFSEKLLPLPQDFRAKVLIFGDPEHYRKVTRDLGLPVAAYGMYVSGLDAVIMHRETGLGTLTHELSHAFFFYLKTPLPGWAHEGVPVFFEKFFALREDGEIKFRFGFANPWRLAELRETFKGTSLENILRERSFGVSESKDGLVSYFLWHQHVFERFVKDLAADRAGGDGISYLFLNASERDSRWREFLEFLESQFDLLAATPPSSIVGSRDQWIQLGERHSLSPD